MLSPDTARFRALDRSGVSFQEDLYSFTVNTETPEVTLLRCIHAGGKTGMSVHEYDVLVIGGGTGGLVAATRCADYGLKTALVERDRLGGECLWTGCVPTKAMLYSAEVRHIMERADRYGLVPCVQPVDWARVVRAKDEVVARIAQHDSPEAIERAGVTVIKGNACFISPHQVDVDGRAIRAKHVVVATGSRQSEPKHIQGLTEVGYITHVEAVNLQNLPASIAIIGGGPVGVEFGQMFARLGSQVTLLERSELILSKEDPEVSAYLEGLLEREGIAIKHHCAEKQVSRKGQKKLVKAQIDGGPAELEVDEVMLATGRAPNLEGLGIEAIGVKTGPRGIEVDEQMRTSVPHIFACGDIAGKYLFTHMAEYQGTIVAHNIAFPNRPRHVDYRVLPWATFTDPEVAHVGLTEPQARQAGHDIVVDRDSFAGLDRAVTMRKTEGFVKIVADARTGEILGAHIIGPGAGNIIHEYVLAMKERVPLPAIADTIHIYPTLSEALKWAAAEYSKGPNK